MLALDVRLPFKDVASVNISIDSAANELLYWLAVHFKWDTDRETERQRDRENATQNEDAIFKMKSSQDFLSIAGNVSVSFGCVCVCVCSFFRFFFVFWQLVMAVFGRGFGNLNSFTALSLWWNCMGVMATLVSADANMLYFFLLLLILRPTISFKMRYFNIFYKSMIWKTKRKLVRDFWIERIIFSWWNRRFCFFWKYFWLKRHFSHAWPLNLNSRLIFFSVD